MRAVLSQGQLLQYGPGDVVFRQGEQGERLFVVKSGVLEVVAAPTDGADAVRRLPRRRRGDRRAGAPDRLAAQRHRALPERAVLFAVDKAVFFDLMDVLPAFARNLCVVLARRLEATTLKVPRAAGKQLQGNLHTSTSPRSSRR